jgi:hypothetical protein
MQICSFLPSATEILSTNRNSRTVAPTQNTRCCNGQAAEVPPASRFDKKESLQGCRLAGSCD